MPDSIREFLNSFKQGTCRVYAAGLEAFLKFYRSTGKGQTLDDFLDAVEEDLRRSRRERKRVARNVLKEFVRWMEQKNYAPKSIRVYVSAVQSFAGYYDLTISTRYIDMPSSRPVSDKFPWTLDKVADFIGEISDPEIKSIAVTIFQSGLSVSDMLDLRYKDIKTEFEKGISPLCCDLARIKTPDTPFMTFIGKWAVSLLGQHLEKKRLQLETPLYTMSHRLIDLRFEDVGKKWLGSWKGQNPMRPHSLRAAFNTLLKDAGCPESYVEFFMGHKIAEVRRVYISKSREGWRSEYRKYEEFLTPRNFKEG